MTGCHYSPFALGDRMKKMLLTLLVAFFFVSSIAFAALTDETTSESSSIPVETGPPVIIPPLPPCANYCIEVSNCSCGETEIAADEVKYCNLNNVTFTTPAECEMGPAPPEGYGEVLPCRNDCSAVFDCWCGEDRVGPIYGEYCSPDNAAYSSEAGCKLGIECVADPQKGKGEEGEPTNITGAITGIKSPLEIISNWQGLSILAIIFSIILVAIGYVIGIGFDMPEMKAWASTELIQVFSNVFIIAFLLIIATFLDVFIMEVVNNSGVGNIQCALGENCLNKTSQAYLADYIDIGKSEAKNVVENSVTAAGWMNRRIGANGKTLIVPPLLMFSLSLPMAPWYTLDFDRLGMVFNYYQGILSSLEAQSFFISEISFKVAPMLLAIGIVCRSFFVTRKLGGLLIAIAISVMIFFPMMYVFDWMSLDIVASGDMPGDIGLADCPAECSLSAPLAYYGDTKITSLKELYCLFPESQSEQVRDLSLGKLASLDSPAVGTVNSCDFENECSRMCRELPYPYTIPECGNYTMQVACSTIPVQCKVLRTLAPASIDPAASEQCPDDCKIIPPLQSNCDTGDCLESRTDCRVAKKSDLEWRPTMDKKMPGKKKCDMADDCLPNATDAFNSCTYVLPDFGVCDNLCRDCPNYCRLDITTGLPTDCYKDDGTTLIDACTKCTGGCKAMASALTTSCNDCPLAYRIMGENLKPEYTYGYCDPSACPYNETYRALIPYSTCEKCIYADDAYEYNPPVRTNCADLCKSSTNVPSKSSGDYTKIGDDGLVGKTEIRKVSMLMIPAYLLPLVNIAATLILIRSLSAILGGDVEIPGLSKIF